DGETAGAHLERAVLGEESGPAHPIDADEGPVRLLAGEAARKPPAARLPGQRGDQGVDRRGRLGVDDLALAERVAPRRGALASPPEVAGRLAGKDERIEPAVSAPHGACPLPGLPVDGALDRVVGRVFGSGPAHDQAGEVALAAEIEGEGLGRAGARIA